MLRRLRERRSVSVKRVRLFRVNVAELMGSLGTICVSARVKECCFTGFLDDWSNLVPRARYFTNDHDHVRRQAGDQRRNSQAEILRHLLQSFDCLAVALSASRNRCSKLIVVSAFRTGACCGARAIALV